MPARRRPVDVPLDGGNMTGGVVRVGNTVRRPATPASTTVHCFLAHLNEVGYSGAPRTLGFDERGRHVVEYVDGDPHALRAPRASCRFATSRKAVA
jgi:hypothetical protein